MIKIIVTKTHLLLFRIRLKNSNPVQLAIEDEFHLIAAKHRHFYWDKGVLIIDTGESQTRYVIPPSAVATYNLLEAAKDLDKVRSTVGRDAWSCVEPFEFWLNF